MTTNFYKSKFARNVVTLMTGTGLAQALPIALSPILTRLYTPDDFGILALYASICSILTVFVGGKYELAIVVPKYKGEALNIAVLSAVLSVVMSCVLLVLLFIFDDAIVRLLNAPEIGPWLYFIPLTTLILGCYHVLNYWANRRVRYRNMAVSRIVQSATTSTVQLVTGLLKLGLSGLIFGQLVGQFISTILLGSYLSKGERRLLQRVSIKRMQFVAKKYIKYPLYMAPGQVMSVGAAELPLLLLTVFFGAGVAGLYSLAYRVMAAPLSLVASAVGDVYRQNAAEQYIHQGQCLSIFLVSLKRLVLFGLLPMLPMLFFGPSLFAFVFGETWRDAGEIASILSILMFFQTVSSPLSSTVLLPGWLRLDFLWQISRLGLAALAFYFGYSFGGSYKLAIAAFVGAFSLMYMLHSYFQYQAARGTF